MSNQINDAEKQQLLVWLKQTFAEKFSPRWLKSLDRKEKLHNLAIGQALNLPIDDELQINQDKSRRSVGITWKEILSLGGLSALILWLLLQFGILGAPTQDTTLSPSGSNQPTNTDIKGKLIIPDAEYKIRFYDKDGNLIEVPHISTKGKVEQTE